jgi:predicted enzyme related to lactoylglutathione lyase
MEVRPRESIILVEDFDALVKWYCDVLDFVVKKRFDEFHYCNIENASGIKIAIGLASEMDVELHDRKHNSIVLQFEVDDVVTFLTFVEEQGGLITGPAIYNEKDGFWFGSFADPEGNAHWVVDSQCP